MIWFTSDTHLSHIRILVYCNRTKFLNKQELNLLYDGAPLKRRNHDGWLPSKKSLDYMDDYLIDKINEYVKKTDILWHLGDFCFPSSLHVAEKFRKRINCRTVNLIYGNHDSKSIKNSFNRSYVRYNLKHQGQYIVLDHYCLAIWQGSHKGAWMLYGHSHGTAEDKLDELRPNRKSIDVGVDNAYKVLGDYRPFSFDEIKNIMDKKVGDSLDVGVI